MIMARGEVHEPFVFYGSEGLFLKGELKMKKFWCVFFVLMFLVVSANVLVADEVSGDVDVDETEMTVEKVEITDYERQSVNSQLEVALMALTLDDEEDPDSTSSTDDENTMDEVAERHAFIAWAHYNNVPPSRKLQEYMEEMTVTVERTETVTREVQATDEFGDLLYEDILDEDGNTIGREPVMTTREEDLTITEEVNVWDWEAIKTSIQTGDYSFVGEVPVPDGLKSTGNPDGANWGQFKKTLEVQTATMVKANSQNKAKSNNGKSDEKGNNGKGGENGNKGGNGKGNGKNK